MAQTESKGRGYALGIAFNDLRFKDKTFEQFIEVIRKWYAGIPYSITDKNQRSAEGRLQGKNEQLYQALLYAAFLAVGGDISAEERPVWAVGLNISEDHRTIDRYKIVRVK